MNISKVAKASGLTAKTIRYYESIGLITPPVRSANGYRSYGEAAVRELRFVKRARETGFNLEECQELLALYRDEHRTSAQVKKLAQEKIADLRERISGLQAMLASLEKLTCCCHGDGRPECPILEEFEKG
ncbi:Cu(I)-responsive transcriptional regulator [Aeromonas diversa]|uniref:HTH-type transcriptional regulator CueR n=1 Tax=Aeromonas diversa CDC 2478-85 TaxID=1268237 RepID=N9V4Z1_9GAMM|nr:Cu(I)-responsive transcriptional regulator [Aeromonas diversa]ENY70402.1 Cu(I)-responsive transcriptional regulator [Aeromonas diversa CDC 2478-85]